MKPKFVFTESRPASMRRSVMVHLPFMSLRVKLLLKVMPLTTRLRNLCIKSISFCMKGLVSLA